MAMNIISAPACLLCYLYFLQGLPYGLQARFLPIYFRAHGMSLTNIGFIKALFFPWLCKTLWAPFVDRHGNKKVWLTWSMFGLGVTCVTAACIEPSWLLPLSIILLVFNLLTSTQDIATDGLAIEILTSSQVASGNIAQVVGYKCGAIIGGGLLAWLSDYISWGTIFVSLTLIYATAIGVVRNCVPEGKVFTFDVPEPQASDYNDSRESVKAHSLKGSGDAVSNKNTGAKGIHAKQNLSAEKSQIMDSDTEHLEPKGSHEVQNSSNLPNDSESGFGWIKGHFSDVLKAEGTLWILLYVLVYKLGEQGALNMMPMFLIDHGVGAADVGLWTGVVGQAVSILGSVLGGAVISSGRHSALGFLWQLTVVKVVVLAAELFAIASLSASGRFLGLGEVPCVLLMLMLLLVSGAVSTAAFTLMMMCSQRASPHCQASHYSLLATVEVLGKLVFSVFVGAITDVVGYPLAFGLFLTLSIVVLPLFSYAPPALVNNPHSNGNSSNKNH